MQLRPLTYRGIGSSAIFVKHLRDNTWSSFQASRVPHMEATQSEVNKPPLSNTSQGQIPGKKNTKLCVFYLS